MTAVMTALRGGGMKTSGEATGAADQGTQIGIASVTTAVAIGTKNGTAMAATLMRISVCWLTRAVLRTEGLRSLMKPRCIAVAGRRRRERTRGMASATAPTASSASVTAGLSRSIPSPQHH